MTSHSSNTVSSTHVQRLSWSRHGMMALGIILSASLGLWFYFTGGRYVSTNNAYIKAQKILLTSEVSGPIVHVSVKNNQAVSKGQELFRIDSAFYEIALIKAQADLAAASMKIHEMKAKYQQTTAAFERADIAAKFAEQELKRVNNLIQRGSISLAQRDEAQFKRDQSRQDALKLKAEIAEILSSLNGDPNITPQQHPLFLSTQAVLEKTRLDLEKTRVVAPADGFVGDMPNVGDFAKSGLPIVNFISSQKVWVEANFKETELTHVQPGQYVRVHIDMYPDTIWTGKVESISPATGSEFSLLPAQNATGNWVKVVQRISAHIELESGPSDKPLKAGMSTEVEIDTGNYPNFQRQASL